MLKNFSLFKISSAALVSLVLSSCVPNSGNSLRSRDTSNATSGNSAVGIGQGRVLSDNPIILTKNSALSDSFDLNRLLTTVPITNDAFLTGNHSLSHASYGLKYYFEVRENQNRPSALQTTNGKWAFAASTPEFLQVNTFYHLNKVIDMFYKNLTQSYSSAYDELTSYDSALPLGIFTSLPAFNGTNITLTAYSNCDVANNSYFDRAHHTLCFGYTDGHSSLKWAQDSSVIFHEAGHFFQKTQLNLRNYTGIKKVDLGIGAYDEAGSIGEGLSDYYSYFVNGRTHFAEWGAGRYLNASRPISENDSLHISGLSTDPDQRLSYPQYIGYDPNRPTAPVEDIHLSGMIISHYLVALTEDLESKCSLPKKDASNLIVRLLSETLAELGDLSSKGTDNSAVNKINLNPIYSHEWFSKVNPINYRSFMQTFSKNLLRLSTRPILASCNYSSDQIESLIDQYGLLLFRTYNENRNHSNLGAYKNTPVSELNRKKSVLIKKDLLILDPSTSASAAYVIDNREQMMSGIASLRSSGVIGDLSTQTESDLGFNNNNGKVSPGEVVALAINLYNNSNSPMGGIQILANDWDHADATNGNPCKFSTTLANDQWPLTSEGGSPCSTTAGGVTTEYSPHVDTAADFAPVCFIQSNETSATKWISQAEFKTKMALNSSLCLDPTAGKEKECFVRAIKGADQAYFSKLNPKSTWGQTMADPTSGKAPSFDWGNILLFEVSKHIPPGTVINCRLRLRFTNCDDCYHDPSSARKNLDFTDTDYNGPRPFKIIHLQIPITD